MKSMYGEGLIQNQIRPGVNEMQRRTVEKPLGLRSLSCQDSVRVLSNVTRQLASYTEPDNT